jgi:hypothetical protein
MGSLVPVDGGERHSLPAGLHPDHRLGEQRAQMLESARAAIIVRQIMELQKLQRPMGLPRGVRTGFWPG